MRSIPSSHFHPETLRWSLVHSTATWGKVKMLPSSCPRWHAGLPTRLMANAVQFRPSPVLWLFIDTRTFFGQEAAHEDRDSER